MVMLPSATVMSDDPLPSVTWHIHHFRICSLIVFLPSTLLFSLCIVCSFSCNWMFFPFPFIFISVQFIHASRTLWVVNYFVSSPSTLKIIYTLTWVLHYKMISTFRKQAFLRGHKTLKHYLNFWNFGLKIRKRNIYVTVHTIPPPSLQYSDEEKNRNLTCIVWLFFLVHTLIEWYDVVTLKNRRVCLLLRHVDTTRDVFG